MMTMMTRQKTKSSSRSHLIVLLALCLSFVLIQSTNAYGGFTQVAAQEDVGDRFEKWQPKYTPEKAEQCLAQKYKGTRNGSIAQSSTNILVYGNSVSRRFYQLLSAYLLSVSGTEEDALAAQELRLMTRKKEKVKCKKELPGISCSTEIIYSKDNVGQRKIVVYFHFQQRIWSKNLEAVIAETAPQIVIGNAGLDNYFCQHALHDEPRCGEKDKSLSSIQNSLEGSAEWEEQIKTWKLNLVERADKLADLVNSAKSKFGTKFVWRKSTCVCTKWNTMPSSYAHSKHNETLLNWFLNTSDSIVQEILKLDSNNILDASDLTRLNTEPYAKVCELYEDHVHPKRRIHDILIDDMLGLLCSAEPKGNGEGEDGEIDTKSTVEDENLNDPGSFGELPAYKESDSFGRRTGSRWTGAGAAMLWDVGDTFGKAWDAGYKKISSHTVPRLSAAHDWSHKYIHENIRDFVPKEYSPFLAAVITYSLPLLPVCVVIFILNRLKAMLSLQKVLLVVNAYNATYCFILWFINALTGNEPMASLQASNEADYIILQFLKCVSYAVYLFIQLFHIAILYGTKAETMKTVAIGNFFLSVCIGFHYFIKVWSPAMHGHPPATSQITYILYTMMFGTMAYSSYLRDPQERAQAASVSTMFGVDKQF